MMSVEGLVTKETEVKEEDHLIIVFEVTEPVASSEFDTQMVEKMRKVRETMFSVRLLRNADLQEPAAEHELMHRE